MHLYTRIWRYAGDARGISSICSDYNWYGFYSIPLCLYLVSHYHVLSILLHGSSLQVLLVWDVCLLHYWHFTIAIRDDGEISQVPIRDHRSR